MRHLNVYEVTKSIVGDVGNGWNLNFLTFTRLEARIRFIVIVLHVNRINTKFSEERKA